MSELCTVGAQIPGLGTVQRIKPLFGFWDKVRGKYHKDTSAFVATLSGDRKVKIVVRGTADAATSRTRLAADYLARFECADCVPQTLYVDDTHLVLDFVPGTALTSTGLNSDMAARLASFLSRNQPLFQENADPLAVLERYAQLLAQGRYLDHDSLTALLEPAGVQGQGAPKIVCFDDCAVKNFVVRPDGELVYVDAFGILPKFAGSSFVKQALRLPNSMRPLFMEHYLAASPFADQIQSQLVMHCRLHLLERAAVRLRHVQPDSPVPSTRYRIRRNRRALSQSLTRLNECLNLPPDNAAHYQWILKQGAML